MKRRNFIKILGLNAVGTAALGSTLVGCTEFDNKLNNSQLDDAEQDNYGWGGPDPQEQDIRMQVLSYAILCPNPHNIQPWIIRLTGPLSFELYVDPERLLPATDPYYRQIHIGQGTFLETLAIAASGLSYEAKIDYFPQGMYSNAELLNAPVASVMLIERKEQAPDPLFNHLLTRHSNKREYNNLRLTTAQVNSLETFHTQHSPRPLTIVNTVEAKHYLAKMLTEAMIIEVGDTRRDKETIQMFRFNEAEVKQYRDGFGLSQAGLSGFKKRFVETFLLSRSRVEQDATEFGQQAVTKTQQVAESTANFGWIKTSTNSRLDQVKVGRDYCRMNLKATAMGLALHPMSQVLQEYPAMQLLQASFKKTFAIDEQDTVQMLFRLGKADATPHGPRRLISQLIRN